MKKILFFIFCLSLSFLKLSASVTLYGVAQVGGTSGVGTLFKFDPSLSNTITVLNSFDNTNGAYPVGINSWDALQAAITGAGIGVNQVPQAPNGTYCYAGDGTTYVLQSTLEDSGNSALKSTYSGPVPSGSMNCSCAGPSSLDYCLSL